MKIGEEVNISMERKKKIIYCLSSIVLAGIIVLGFSIDVISEWKNAYIENHNREKVLYVEDFESRGYGVEDGWLIAQTDDPQLSIYNDDNDISDIVIKFEESLKQALTIQIYYDENGTGYSEESSELMCIPEGSSEVCFDIMKKNVTNLRIDVGSAVGDQFRIKEIIINDSSNNQGFLGRIKNNIRNLQWGRFVRQWELLAIVILFIGMHFFVDIKRMYKCLFKRRWIVATLLLLFLVVNRFNGESLAVYDEFIQPGQGNEFVQPIFGKARQIRSDDYVVETPNKMASIIDGNYDKYNYISRGTKTLNCVNGVYVGYETLGRNPFQYVYKIMPAENAYSFCWYAPIIICFMIAIEFFYLLSRQNALVAVAGACLEILSSFFLWWGFPGFLIGGQGAIVCAYYFIYEKKLYKKILWGVGVAIAFANYVLNLYPAWIVPMGYVLLCCLIWLIHDNWTEIKQFKKKDWLIILVMGMFSVSLICSYLILSSEYVYAITHTIYPGKRVSSGGFSLNKIFYYAQSYLYAYREIGNPAEAGVVMSFFPVPTFVIAYDWLKEKKKDWLKGGLLIVTFVFLIYVTVGIPETLSKVLLLSYTTGPRLVDIIGIIQVYFIVIILGKKEYNHEMNIWTRLGISLFAVVLSLFFSKKAFPNYLSWKWMLISGILIFVCCMLLVTNTRKQIKDVLCGGLILFSIFSSVYIRPISVGFDAITSKPVSKEIRAIVEEDKDAKWVAYGGTFHLPGFAIANGAPTINSANIYPNLELWEKLDADKQYEEVYNRYAHINVEFTEDNTSFEMSSVGDQIILDLSYKDMKKAEIGYVLSLKELVVDNDYVWFEEVYDEAGCFIYQVNYK